MYKAKIDHDGPYVAVKVLRADLQVDVGDLAWKTVAKRVECNPKPPVRGTAAWILLEGPSRVGVQVHGRWGFPAGGPILRKRGHV